MSGKMALETPSAMVIPVGAPPPSGTSAITADFSSFTSPDWIGMSELQESQGQSVEVVVGSGGEAGDGLGLDRCLAVPKGHLEHTPVGQRQLEAAAAHAQRAGGPLVERGNRRPRH